MNYIKLLTGFFQKVSEDDRLNPTHISMYVSLFQLWNANRFKNPISISRSLVMHVCKISSTATYHKCIKELHQFGYLTYTPSYNPYKGSLVLLFDFYPDEKEEQEEKEESFQENKSPKNSPKNTDNITKNQTGKSKKKESIHTKNQTSDYQQLDLFCRAKIETSSKQALIPYINNTNIINIKDKHKKENEISKPVFSKKNNIEMKKEKEKNSAKKETQKTSKKAPSETENNSKKAPSGDGVNSNKAPQGVGVKAPSGVGVRVGVPTLDSVLEYFLLKKYAPIEAEKFFNYFQSNGWLVGGKAKMKDWNAAARNWVLNAKKYNQPKAPSPIATNLQTLKNKNYNEPL